MDFPKKRIFVAGVPPSKGYYTIYMDAGNSMERKHYR